MWWFYTKIEPINCLLMPNEKEKIWKKKAGYCTTIPLTQFLMWEEGHKVPIHTWKVSKQKQFHQYFVNLHENLCFLMMLLMVHYLLLSIFHSALFSLLLLVDTLSLSGNIDIKNAVPYKQWSPNNDYRKQENTGGVSYCRMKWLGYCDHCLFMPFISAIFAFIKTWWKLGHQFVKLYYMGRSS